MSVGSTLASLLTAVKANAAAVAVAGAVVVGGGAAAAAVATGAVHMPGHGTEATGTHTPDATTGAAARLAACSGHNGDATRLATVYGPMFAGDTKSAKDEICSLFVGSDGHAYGFGEIQQVLDIAAAIERSGDGGACLTKPLATPAPGKPADAGQPSATAPTQTASGTTMALIGTIMTDAKTTPLEQLARNCNVPHRPLDAGTGGGQGGQGGGKPEGTPGAKPTGTPGRP
jgi:hypothetical protein